MLFFLSELKNIVSYVDLLTLYYILTIYRTTYTTEVLLRLSFELLTNKIIQRLLLLSHSPVVYNHCLYLYSMFLVTLSVQLCDASLPHRNDNEQFLVLVIATKKIEGYNLLLPSHIYTRCYVYLVIYVVIYHIRWNCC